MSRRTHTLILLIGGILLLPGCKTGSPRPEDLSRNDPALPAVALQPLPTYSGFVPTPQVMRVGVGGAPPTPFAGRPSPTPAAMPTATPTWTPSPTVTPLPTNTAAPSPLATPLPSATPALAPPQPVSVNGVPFESIIVMPPEVVAHVREIFATGLALGRNPNAYAKIGDSTTENPHFMARFDEGGYSLGGYAHLQPAVDQFHGSHGRDSVAVRIGLHSWTANDPAWAEPGLCLPNETPVQCELRLHNPSIVFIRLGTNDVGVGLMFEANIRYIVDTALAAGVIPIIGTKGDRHEGSNENNDILRRIAAEYRIPLWDYDRVADTLPGRGLDVDAAHMMTFYSHDYNDPTAFTRGHAMHNLTALMMLDAVWRTRE
jgi:hypothetical protein